MRGQREAKITSYYQREATRWARGSAPYQQPILDSFLQKISCKKEMSGWACLDLGTGVGRNLRALSKHFHRVMAVDVSEDGLKEARDNVPSDASIQFLRYDGFSLPFPNRAFDLVVCTEVLEHVANFRVVMKEISRVLTPGGFVIASVPNYFNLAGLIKLVMDVRTGSPQWEPWGSHPGGFERFTTWLWLERNLKRLGMALQHARGANMTLAWPGLERLPLGRRVLLKLEQYPASWRVSMNYYILARSLKEIPRT